MDRSALCRSRLATALVPSVLLLLLLSYSARAQHNTALKRRRETVLSSLPFDPAQAGGLSLSAGATRGAYVRRSATGASAVIDGTEGPAYDDISRAGIAFGPDGRHAAYAARKGAAWHLVLDGAEGEGLDAIRDDTLTFGGD